MNEAQKDVQQLSLLRSVFAAIALKDSKAFGKLIKELASMREEEPRKVIFDIICSLDSNINELVKRGQAA